MGENQRTMEKKGEKRVLILLLKLELEELEKVETIGESSTVCKDLISSVESIPDPLLPFTKGSVDAGWDRWFGGAHHSRNHKRWI
ncbi:Guanine nucleotide-binding protein subunit gamma 1 [Glycine max]|nr:Guanine nucleotide-binding protein subunit gamma 1 [Glycine max]